MKKFIVAWRKTAMLTKNWLGLSGLMLLLIMTANLAAADTSIVCYLWSEPKNPFVEIYYTKAGLVVFSSYHERVGSVRVTYAKGIYTYSFAGRWEKFRADGCMDNCDASENFMLWLTNDYGYERHSTEIYYNSQDPANSSYQSTMETAHARWPQGIGRIKKGAVQDALFCMYSGGAGA